MLESGAKYHGAKKILRRHYGTEKLGGVNSDEILNMGEVIKNGSVLLESFEKRPDRIRYAYEWDNNGVKLRLVVDDLKDSNKIFNFYSDRNTTGAGPIQDPPAKNNPTLKETTSQGKKLPKYNITLKDLKEVLKSDELNADAVEYIHQNKHKLVTDTLSIKEAKALNFKNPSEGKAVIDYQSIQHALNRHGKDSMLVKQSKQEPIAYEDIAHYRNIVQNADETLVSRDRSGNKVLVSFKQVNGHYIVVEQVGTKNNRLSFKTMFKVKGNYKDGSSYKNIAKTP
ncbi:DUF3519 domain-containing protein [Helicobacter pylori]|uniref:PBECR3 domain-containing polyvalent protein n=1 Tax=Helicobacter pylori TaxID=210 RepID=UPI000A4D58F9|nr:DUF3519 domain-containing protein [Helicobacter pylori]